MRTYPYLASRIFGVPLLIERHKLDAILVALGPRLGLDLPAVETSGPGDAKQRKPYFVTADNIAIIEIIGPLVKRNSGEFISGGPTTYGEVENEFMDAATDPAIKGVMLLVDSPGGESSGAMELADLIYSQRGSKPIFAVADGDAFSAAYAIASAADRLFLSKSSGVGSVGVWMLHVDQSAYDAKEGIKPTLIFAGARKVDGNPFEPLTQQARDAFQAEVDRTYVMFVSTVARNRDLLTQTVIKTEAALFFGAHAVAVGFADQLGTFSDAMAALQAAVKTKGVAMPPSPAVSVEVPVPAAAAESAAPPSPDPRAAILAYAADVIDLCLLAKMPELATAFILGGKPLEDVRACVQTARATADAQKETIRGSLLPDTGADSSKPGKSASAPTPEQIEASPIVQAARRCAADLNKSKKKE